MKQTDIGFVNPGGLYEFGPTINVQVGLDYQTFPHPNVERMTPPIYALIDTGASLTCIDKTLAVQQNLPIRGEPFFLSGISGVNKVNRHLGQIYIPALDATIYGLFPAVDLSTHVHKALIGRAFLRSCQIFYDGKTGKVTMTYCPS